MNKKSKRVMIALYIAGLIMVVLSSWVPGITSLTLILLFITMSSLWCLMLSVVINMSNEYNYQRIIYDKDNKIELLGVEIHNLTNILRAKDASINELTYKLADNYITNRKKKNLDIDSEPVSPRNVNIGPGHPAYDNEFKLWYGNEPLNNSEKL